MDFGGPPPAPPMDFGGPPPPAAAPGLGAPDPYGAPPPAPAYGGPPPAFPDPSGQAPYANPPAPFGQNGFAPQQAMVPAGQPAAGMGGPKGQFRNPIMVLLISMFCFVYGLYQYYVMLGELKDYLQSDEINPIHAFIPILQLLLIFKLPGWVLEAKQRAGIPNPEVTNILFYWFFGLYFLPKDLNEVWDPTGQLHG